jgi:hypothetical protein
MPTLLVSAALAGYYPSRTRLEQTTHCRPAGSVFISTLDHALQDMVGLRCDVSASPSRRYSWTGVADVSTPQVKVALRCVWGGGARLFISGCCCAQCK